MNTTTNNVNPDEIAKFSQLADQWWDDNGPMKPLHQLNPLRLQYIQDNAALKEKKVLDIGCGGGILTEALATVGAITTGIDMSKKAIAIAKQHTTESQLNIHYEVTTTEDFAQKNEKQFDVITCMEMLEHVPNPSSIIAATKKLIKPSGFLFFSTINRTARAFFKAIVGAEYILQLLPKGTHHHGEFIRPSELVHWASQYQLQFRDMRGITYHPLKNQFSFTKKVDVNYLMYFQAPYDN